ncbi:MAG: hypothetical protein COA73_11845 [Candidatus Hydrogenedentota bacterium]|nr:MAG: hypothetical protein COA73_11845 [Candidatus Hydrogenedentota bacterium]
MPGIAIAIVIGVAAFIGIKIWIAQQNPAPRTEAKPNPAAQISKPATEASTEQLEAVDRIKQVLQDLIRNFTQNTDQLNNDALAYNTSLERHKESLQKLVTIEDLRELERSLLQQVDEIQTANQTYRRQLVEVNNKVKTQQQELERLHTVATKDFLTDIPNRRVLEERLNEMMQLARRHGHLFSIIVFDIDHFKKVNDTHGHLAGDRILKAVAHSIDQQRRSTDFLARYGGEEFVLVLPETSLDQAGVLADKIRRKVGNSKFTFEQAPIPITLSAGASQIDSDAESDTVDELFKRADAALYRAKENGRNRVELAQP